MSKVSKEKVVSPRRYLALALREMRSCVKKGTLVYKEYHREPTVFRAADACVTYFASVSEDGRIVHNSNQACHAGLGYHEGGKIKYLISRLQWGKKWDEKIAPKEAVIAFLEWLTVTSPYSPVFVYKGGAKAFRRGFVITGVDYPANLVAGAMFAHRAVTEHGSRIMVSWWEMVKRGLNPDVAFIYAQNIYNGAEGIKLGSSTMSSHNWHVAIPTYVDKDFIDNFRKRVMPKARQNYSKQQDYTPVQELWGSQGREGYLRNEIAALHLSLEKTAIKETGVVNPFASGTRMKNLVKAEDFYDKLVVLLKEKFGE